MKFTTEGRNLPASTYLHDSSMLEPAIRRCNASKLLGVDTETLGKKYTNMTDQVVVMTLCPDDQTRFFVPRKFMKYFKAPLENPRSTKALTNVKFDAHRLMNTAGIELKGRWADTVMMDFLYDEDTRENKHGLKPTAYDHLDLPMREYNDLFGKTPLLDIQPGHELWDLFLEYATKDAWASRELVKFYEKELSAIQLWEDDDWSMWDHYWDIEGPQLQTLWRMERRGIRIDVDYTTSLQDEFAEEMQEAARTLSNLAGKPINPGSTKQVAALLFGDMGLKVIKQTPGGEPSVDRSVLDHYSGKGVEEAKLIQRYKKAEKNRGFCKGLAEKRHTDGHIHTEYSATKLTGRLSSRTPNLQQIPARDPAGNRIRAAFIADPGMVLIGADYSQLEFRVAAFAGNDVGMIEAIKKGLDMHCDTAAKMYNVPYEEMFDKAKIQALPEWKEKRDTAKAIGFGVLYGKTKYGLAREWNCSEAEAQKFIDMFFKARPGLAQYVASTQADAKRDGFVRTLSGRRRRFSILKKKGASRGDINRALRQAINAPIQGSAADIVKKAMVTIDSDEYLTRELGVQLLLQVHDELIMQCPEETAEEALPAIQSYMENPFMDPLPVPLEAKPTIVQNWRELK